MSFGESSNACSEKRDGERRVPGLDDLDPACLWALNFDWWYGAGRAHLPRIPFLVHQEVAERR